jgi:hypothetical protein
MGLLQSQLTIQTNQPPPTLPVTPHPLTPSSNSLVSVLSTSFFVGDKERLNKLEYLILQAYPA